MLYRFTIILYVDFILRAAPFFSPQLLRTLLASAAEYFISRAFSDNKLLLPDDVVIGLLGEGGSLCEGGGDLGVEVLE